MALNWNEVLCYISIPACAKTLNKTLSKPNPNWFQKF